MAGPNVGYATLSVIPSMRGAQAALAGQAAGPAKAAGVTAGRSMGGSLTSTLGSVLKVGFGGALVAGGVVAGLGKLGASFDDAFDTIRVGTGATGEALDGLEESFKSVFSSLPTDMGSASTAIAGLNTRLGLTGENLEARSAQILELSRITGTDLAQNIESVSRVFGDWGVDVDDQGDRLDQLFRASQATGLGVDVLGRQMVQFGAPLRQLGFDFETSAGLLGKFEKEGVNAELVMGSLRIALGKMARDGEPAEETLQRVTEQIANAGDASEANALALELFGARAGPDMAAAIREGRFELGDLYDTISGGNETILGAAEDTNDWRESWNRLRNQGFVLLEPVATRVFDALGTGMDWVSDKAPIFAAWFSENIFPALSGVAGVMAELVRDGFGALSSWWDDNGDAVLEGLGSIGRVIQDPILVALGALRDVIADDVIPVLGDWVGWIAGNRYILVGLGTLVGTVLVGAMVAYTIAAGQAAIATILATWPFLLLGGLVVALAAGLYYAYENWGWFTTGVYLGLAAINSTIAGIETLVGWLKTAWEWAQNLVDVLNQLTPQGIAEKLGIPGAGTFGTVAGVVVNPIGTLLDNLPFGDDGGVWPGPRGVHSLGWVAGGETLVPTHRSDYDGDGLADSIADRIAGMDVYMDRQKVGGVIRRESSEHTRRNG